MEIVEQGGLNTFKCTLQRTHENIMCIPVQYALSEFFLVIRSYLKSLFEVDKKIIISVVA